MIYKNYSKWTFLIETQNNHSNALNGNDHVLNYDNDKYDISPFIWYFVIETCIL